jgi:DNA-binding XRE family transcriptional regulator
MSHNNNHQDWQTVTVRTKKPAAGAAGKVETAVRSAQNYGSHAAAVERAADEGALKVKRVAPDSVRALVEARLAYTAGKLVDPLPKGGSASAHTVKLTQDKADAECALPKHTIRDIEAGRLVPNGDVLRKISRTLRVDLKMV